ncbi:MAG TPA: SPOR domain-containing protein [Candidatus Marinimicrobia bacterium]|nr:SPOR domain-containing protein [Candidatus Neomarinimicrobiota bacterium]
MIVSHRAHRGIIKNLFFFGLITFGFSQDTDLKKIFDPNEHRDVQPKWPVIINNVLSGDSGLDSILAADTVHWVTDGFRVQVLASKSMTRADSLSELLNTSLKDSAYVVYETPNYKVRIGDYVVREDADKMRQKLQNMGYRSAWVIRTRITPQRTGMTIRMK